MRCRTVPSVVAINVTFKICIGPTATFLSLSFSLSTTAVALESVPVKDGVPHVERKTRIHIQAAV